MHHYLIILAGALRIAATQSTVFVTASVAPTPSAPAGSAPIASIAPVGSATASGAAPAPSSGSGGGPSSSSGVCGHGYTYCGYILRDHQSYPQDDIVKAYCSSGEEYCAGGKPKTDPFQALYVCLPNESSTSPQLEAKDRLRRALGRREVLASSVAAAGPEPSAGAGGSCSAPTTGNKLQMLCSCSGKCLNPDSDHVGRCDKPCS